MTTWAPREASSLACSKPRPPPAPVMIATLPSNPMSAMAREGSDEQPTARNPRTTLRATFRLGGEDHGGSGLSGVAGRADAGLVHRGAAVARRHRRRHRRCRRRGRAHRRRRRDPVPALAGDADLRGAAPGPATAVLKLPHTVAGARQTADAFSFYGREVNFYREAGHRTPLGTPGSTRLEYDPATKDFVLLLEDLGDRTQYDQLDGCSIDDALIAAKELAVPPRLVVAGPGHHRRRLDLPDLRPAEPPGPAADPAPVLAAHRVRVRPPPARPLLDAARRMPDACVELLERLSEPPLTLLHGDYRLDNLFFDPGAEDPVVAIDWQICGLGRSPYDIAYFMSQSLTPEDRKAADEQVLRTYYDSLRAGGVEDYTYDQCWEDYRLGILFCLSTRSTPAPSTWSTTGPEPSSRPCSPAPPAPSSTSTPWSSCPAEFSGRRDRQRGNDGGVGSRRKRQGRGRCRRRVTSRPGPESHGRDVLADRRCGSRLNGRSPRRVATAWKARRARQQPAPVLDGDLADGVGTAGPASCRRSRRRGGRAGAGGRWLTPSMSSPVTTATSAPPSMLSTSSTSAPPSIWAATKRAWASLPEV